MALIKEPRTTETGKNRFRLRLHFHNPCSTKSTMLKVNEYSRDTLNLQMVVPFKGNNNGAHH